MTIAIRRVDKTREDLNKPPAPVQPGQQVIPLGPTVAQDLILALNDLQQVQNNLISVVMNHIENRLLLYRELGILELDDCGMWIDRPINESEWLTESECPLPPDLPVEWLDEAEVSQEDVDRFQAEHADEGIEDRFKALVSATHAALRGGEAKSRVVPSSVKRTTPAKEEFSVERRPERSMAERVVAASAGVSKQPSRKDLPEASQAEFVLPASVPMAPEDRSTKDKESLNAPKFRR